MTNRRPLGKGILPKATKPATVPGSVARKEADEATPAAARQALRPHVLKYLNVHIGTPIHIDEMVESLGRPKASIQNVIAILLREGLLNIAILSHGNSWIYRGLHEDVVKEAAPVSAAPAPAVGSVRMYEEMGTDKAGRRILKDEEGRLWAAEEL